MERVGDCMPRSMTRTLKKGQNPAYRFVRFFNCTFAENLTAFLGFVRRSDCQLCFMQVWGGKRSSSEIWAATLKKHQ